MGRTPRLYRAQLQRADGQILEREIECYWSPEKDFTIEAVKNAAAAEAAFETRNEQGACIPHAGLSALLVK